MIAVRETGNDLVAALDIKTLLRLSIAISQMQVSLLNLSGLIDT